jgi:dethiobiotin synthetase
MPRVVVLGAGTGVGKTWVSVALIEALTQAGESVLGLKPIETGIDPANPILSDAHAVGAASGRPQAVRAPLYGLRAGVSPHLAARLEGVGISVARIQSWVAEQEAIHAVSHGANFWTVVETAGGVFSPFSSDASNFELACGLEPASWLLVASDSLGVLHDLTAALEAMRARGRSPDQIVLSQARLADASTGSNGRELELLGIAAPVVTFGRDSKRAAEQVLQRLRAQSALRG